MEKHVELLGKLFIVYHGIFVVLGILGFVFLAALAIVPDLHYEMMAALSLIWLIGGVFYLILVGPGIIAGIGLLKRKTWARILAIILAILNLPVFPFGTALGIYALYVLLKEDVTPLFS